MSGLEASHAEEVRQSSRWQPISCHESAFGTSLHTSHNELQQKMCSIQTWLYMLGGYEQDGDRRHEAQRQIQKTIMLRAAMQVIVFVCQDVGMDALDLQSLSSLQISSPPSLDHQIGQLTLHTSDQQDQPEDGISLSRVPTVPNTPIDSPLEGSNTNQDQQVTVYVPDSASITKALILTIQKDEIGRDHLDNILEGVSEVHCSERCVLSNGESTLIHEAVSSGKPEYLSSLLEHDSHCKQELIDKFDKDRYTPLILAARQACQEKENGLQSLELLLLFKCDVERALPTKNNEHACTVWCHATQRNVPASEKFVRVLLANNDAAINSASCINDARDNHTKAKAMIPQSSRQKPGRRQSCPVVESYTKQPTQNRRNSTGIGGLNLLKRLLRI